MTEYNDDGMTPEMEELFRRIREDLDLVQQLIERQASRPSYAEILQAMRDQRRIYMLGAMNKDDTGVGDRPVGNPGPLPVTVRISLDPTSVKRLQERLQRFQAHMKKSDWTPPGTVRPIKTADDAAEDFGDFINWYAAGK